MYWYVGWTLGPYHPKVWVDNVVNLAVTLGIVDSRVIYHFGNAPYHHDEAKISLICL